MCFFVTVSLLTGEMTSILARLEHNVLEGDSATGSFFSGGAPHEMEEITSFFLEVQNENSVIKIIINAYKNTSSDGCSGIHVISS